MIVRRLTLVCLLVGVGGLPSGARGQASDSLARTADSTSKALSTVARRVTTAFTQGNASRLLSPSADRVEISLFGARTFYSSAQALYVLREFFRAHVPQRFRVRDVTDTGRSYFVRGTYDQANRTRRLQVYVRLGQPEGHDLWHLHEVRIDGPSE
ncbi:MAG: DUF4783 domain-containing protein [Salinibacter sp.]